MKYRWHEQDGIVDKSGKQIFQLLAVNATKKARREIGKRLAEYMNEMSHLCRPQDWPRPTWRSRE
jgi:hypothetical protein